MNCEHKNSENIRINFYRILISFLLSNIQSKSFELCIAVDKTIQNVFYCILLNIFQFFFTLL